MAANAEEEGMKALPTTTASSSLPTGTYLISLPVPSVHAPMHLLAHLTHFADRSMMIWCGETDASNAALGQNDTQLPADAAPQSSLLIEEHHPQAQQQQSNVQIDSARPPTGLLGREWAVAMTAGSRALSTSLFQSSLDMSRPMAERLAKRFGLAQIFLSLSLPDQLLSMLQGPLADPLGGKAALMLEGALGHAIRESMAAAEGHTSS